MPVAVEVSHAIDTQLQGSRTILDEDVEALFDR